jgi:hypothetical protein
MNKIPNYRVWHKIEKRFVDLRNIDFEQESIGYDCYRETKYAEGVIDSEGNKFFDAG